MNPQDIKGVLYTAEEIDAIVSEMAARISEDYRGERLLLVSVLKGSFIVMADLARKIDPSVDVEVDFMVVSSYGSAATSSGTVNIKKDLSVDIAGRHVLIVEDILDTGLTLSHLIEELRGRGPASLEVAVLLRKDLGHEQHFVPRYLGVVCPNEFVVGYGLDYDERYRNLPYIGILDEKVYS